MWNYNKFGTKAAVVADVQAFKLESKNAAEVEQAEAAKALIVAEINAAPKNGVNINVRGQADVSGNRQLTINVSAREILV